MAGELLPSVHPDRSAGTQRAFGQRCTRDWHQRAGARPPLCLQLLARTARALVPEGCSGAPCATIEALPALYCVILKVSCFLHLGDLQKVRVVFGAFTCGRNEPGVSDEHPP